MRDPVARPGGLGRLTALLAGGLVASLCAPVLAYDYRVPIYIQDEDDINELFYSEDITEEDRDRLIALYRDPLDVNTASRDELYNLPGLSYAMVDAIIERREDKPFTRMTQLTRIPGITKAILAQMEAFARVAIPEKVDKKKEQFVSKVRVKAVDGIKEGDKNDPEGYIRAEAKRRDRKYQFGAAVMLRNTIGAPEWRSLEDGDMPVTVQKFSEDGDPTSTEQVDKYLETSGATWLPAWPKVYAMVNTDAVSALAGSYRVGFGQRLVLDNTGSQNPHGFLPDLEVYEGEDGFGLSKGFFGAVATKRGLSAPAGLNIDTTAFFSWWRFDVYQYDLKHNLKVPGMPDEQETYVVVTPYENGMYRKLSYVTLPGGYSETLGGGNATLNFGPKSHVGVTGWVSKSDFWLGDDNTVFARATAFPERDLFYAFGLDAAAGFDRFSLFGEAGMMDNQAPAGMVRGVAEIDRLTLESSFRYYSFDYDNPYSRGYGMADEFEGDRDKGELGGMLSARYKLNKWLAFRVDQDVWQATQWKDEKEKEAQGEKVHPWRTETYLRVDTHPTESLTLATFVQLNDKNLSESGRDEVYSDTYGSGERYQWGVQAASRVAKQTVLWLYYKLGFEDAQLSEQFQKEHYVTAKLSTRPLDRLGFAVRAKYLKGELEQLTGTTREHFLEGYLQAGIWIMPQLQVGLRGMVRQHIMEKDPTTDESLSFSEGMDKGKQEIFWKAMLEWAF